MQAREKKLSEHHNKLAHLSSEQVKELVDRYYSGQKVSKLLEEYKIDIQPSGLVSLFPPKLRTDIRCPYCDGRPFEEKLASRDGYVRNEPMCPVCGHKDRPDCACRNCREQASLRSAREELIKRDIIENTYADCSCAYKEVTHLTLRDALYLLALYRHSVTEDLTYVSPFSNAPLPLAPVYDLKNELVKHLYSKSLISPSAESESKAFVFDEEVSKIVGYYPTIVEWVFLPGMDLAQKRKFISQVTALSSDISYWPESWKAEQGGVWLAISKAECIEYFLHLLSQRGFQPENIGPKTHDVFEVMLKNFSVAQVFNLTWQAVRDTTDYIVREGLPSYRAKNTFIGSVQRKSEKYIAEGWEVRSSRRDFDCPQSVLSSTFFDVFVGIGARALETRLPIA